MRFLSYQTVVLAVFSRVLLRYTVNSLVQALKGLVLLQIALAIDDFSLLTWHPEDQSTSIQK